MFHKPTSAGLYQADVIGRIAELSVTIAVCASQQTISVTLLRLKGPRQPPGLDVSDRDKYNAKPRMPNTKEETLSCSVTQARLYTQE
jgi:hypothetical protein